MLRLPTLVIGPESQGSGYRVLESSSPVRGAWAVDLPMVLLEWAKREIEDPFAACLYLKDEGALVCRGRFFERLRIGPVAYLNGAILDEEQLAAIGWRTEEIVAKIRDPDQSLAFAAQPLAIDPPLPEYEVEPWDGLGLAWKDRIILCGESIDKDEAVRAALRSVEPPAQRARIRSWATSADLPARGKIDPNRQCQLLVTGADATPPPGFLEARTNDNPKEGERPWFGDIVEPPPSFEVFDTLVKLMRRDERFAGAVTVADWRHDMADKSAEETVAWACGLATQTGARALGIERLVALLTRLLGDRDTRVRDGARIAADAFLGKLRESGKLDSRAGSLLTALGDATIFEQCCPDEQAAAELDSALFTQLAETCPALVGSGKALKVDAQRRAIQRFVAELVKRCERFEFDIEYLFTIIQAWPFESAGGLKDMLTAKTVEALDRLGPSALAAVTRKLIPDDFLRWSEFASEEQAWQRIRTVSAAVACLSR